MQYASGGDLHNFLREKFTEITWNKQKISILWQIARGLETIHNAKFIHRDFHSGNIPLRSFISKCTSINSSKGYNSIELELDIDIKSPNILGTKRNIEELDINSYGNSGKHIKITRSI
ncbi:unnamed protein product [Rhizophagus irregularis]|nr:unnamed protein product [Rhizophagus irregularis]CAB4446708.1 unnamed protein product [Rhizophagus irregularis]